MLGRVGLPSGPATDERRDGRLALGIGREAPKELREPLLDFISPSMLKLCMRFLVSAIADLEAGTSIGPSSASPGTGRVSPNDGFLADGDSPTFFWRCSPIGVCGRPVVGEVGGSTVGAIVNNLSVCLRCLY